MKLFKKVGRAVRKAGRAVDVTASKSAVRGAGRKLDKTVGGQAGWVGIGMTAAGVALTVTGNPALGLGLAGKGVGGVAQAKAGRSAVQGDPGVPTTDYAEGAVAGDPRAAGPSLDPVYRVDPQAAKRPDAATSSSSSSSSPRPSLWARIRAIFTPPRRAA